MGENDKVPGQNYTDTIKHGSQLAGVDHPGQVEDLGFITGEEKPASGWIKAELAGEHAIFLMVNGTEVAQTHAAAPKPGEAGPAAERARFSFRCDSMFDYLGNGDVVTFVCNGLPLYIKDIGPDYRVVSDRESCSGDLLEKLKQGYCFDNLGRFRRRRDRVDKARVLALYRELASFMEERYGYELVVFYGSLLGAVRENDFIRHDSRGLDVIYFSNHSEPEAVKAEFKQVCYDLIEAGYKVQANHDGAYVHSLESDINFVDLNYGWFTEDEELNMAFGWYEKPARGRANYFAFRHTTMAGQTIKIPGNAEEILVQCYGENWQVPDQGFTHDPGKRIIKEEYLLTADDIIEISNFHIKFTYSRWKKMMEGKGSKKGFIKKLTPLPIKKFLRKIIGR